MKNQLYTLLAVLTGLVMIGNSRCFAQANTTLSNLTSPTAVNQSLLPDIDNSKSLGSTNKSWKDFYLDGYLYLDGFQWLANPGSDNTMVGKSAGIHTTGADNTFIGKQAGISNTTGYSNTFIGEDAGWQNTTAYENVFIGTDAGYRNQTGTWNVAIGAGSLLNCDRSGQTAVGYHALYSCTGDPIYGFDENSAFGSFSLEATTTGYENSAFGAFSLNNNTVGYMNSAFGTYSLINNTEGNVNSAFGMFSLEANTTGDENSALGFSALRGNIGGNDNSAFGYYSLRENASGNNNSAFGAYSLEEIETGSYNSVFGSYALHKSDGSNYNTAIGASAGYWQSSDNNVFIGYESGYGNGVNTGGSDNCFVGTHSGYSNKEGEHNCFTGSQAGYGNTSASYGSFVGFDAGGSNTTGSQNTYLGYSTEGNSGTYTNVVGIGYQLTNTASNQARIGNSSITSIGGWVSWTNVSDGRFKKNVKEEVAGLAFINKLRPVTYTLDLHAADAFIGKEFSEDHATDASTKISEQAKSEKEKIVYSGFIAQEVETAAKEIGYDFSGVDAPKNENDLYGLRYAEFVVPLVKAVQELDQENRELKIENSDLKTEVNDLKSRLERIESQLGITGELNKISSNVSRAVLEQNIPNPASQTTTIRFSIPSNANDAQLIITDVNGKTIQQFDHLTIGQSQVEVSTLHLTAGTYQYSLYVDGRKVDTKQMIINK